ncbi:MAG: asparaginase [Flavobacteriales bacterium]
MSSKLNKILLIYTGGTIGMRKHEETGELVPIDFNSIQDNFPGLQNTNILFDMVSMLEVKDSSDISIEDWIGMAKTVEENYDKYLGFVFLHGSDTMAFSASALSFMFENLQKPVIFTGSQLPMGVPRTDALENLLTAMEIASAYKNGKALVPEVSVYFEYKLYRGNRVTKVDAERFNAYASYNYPVLAEAGVNIQYFKSNIINHPNQGALKLNTHFEDSVVSLKIFPGIKESFYARFLCDANIKGVVLESFGAGNLGDKLEIISALKQIINAGGIVLNVSQCLGGSVAHGKYKASSKLQNIGVIEGGEMTYEAAITKMMIVLGMDVSMNQKIEKLKENLRGEK